MTKALTLNDLPDDLARFPSVEDVLRAGVDAFREHAQAERLASLRRDAAQGFASFDRGEGVAATADEFIDGIDAELALGEVV
jgi:Arc/MetJ-type ribon-helix-helix transcriptional regulator